MISGKASLVWEDGNIVRRLLYSSLGLIEAGLTNWSVRKIHTLSDGGVFSANSKQVLNSNPYFDASYCAFSMIQYMFLTFNITKYPFTCSSSIETVHSRGRSCERICHTRKHNTQLQKRTKNVGFLQVHISMCY